MWQIGQSQQQRLQVPIDVGTLCFKLPNIPGDSFDLFIERFALVLWDMAGSFVQAFQFSIQAIAARHQSPALFGQAQDRLEVLFFVAAAQPLAHALRMLANEVQA